MMRLINSGPTGDPFSLPLIFVKFISETQNRILPWGSSMHMFPFRTEKLYFRTSVFCSKIPSDICVWSDSGRTCRACICSWGSCFCKGLQILTTGTMISSKIFPKTLEHSSSGKIAFYFWQLVSSKPDGIRAGRMRGMRIWPCETNADG